jgi:transposase
VSKIGRENIDELLLMARDGDERVPELAWACILALAEQLVLVKHRRAQASSRPVTSSRSPDGIPGNEA